MEIGSDYCADVSITTKNNGRENSWMIGTDRKHARVDAKIRSRYVVLGDDSKNLNSENHRNGD